MTILINVFGVPRERRPDEFYHNNRWMGQTPAEARFVRTVRVALALAVACGLAYYYLH